jgi:hypothetical protein
LTKELPLPQRLRSELLRVCAWPGFRICRRHRTPNCLGTWIYACRQAARLIRLNRGKTSGSFQRFIHDLAKGLGPERSGERSIRRRYDHHGQTCEMLRRHERIVTRLASQTPPPLSVSTQSMAVIRVCMHPMPYFYAHVIQHERKEVELFPCAARMKLESLKGSSIPPGRTCDPDGSSGSSIRRHRCGRARYQSRDLRWRR